MSTWHYPLQIRSERVWRSYLGGRLIDGWQGRQPEVDDHFPEEWIGSTVHARNPGRESLIHEGYNQVAAPDGRTAWLHELVQADPTGMLGGGAAGTTGIPVLVKILDAACRLSIQVHPDREKARSLFHSPFGKTEAWYILGGRSIDGQAPHICLGFRPGVTRAHWEGLYARQDVPGMLDALHRIPVEAGQVYLVDGGVPHAIGAGCLLLEIQEPTDLTLRTEKRTIDGRWLTDGECSLGVGLAGLFDCFHYDGLSLPDTLTRWQLQPQIVSQDSGFARTRLIDRRQVPYFGLDLLTVRTRAADIQSDGFSILTVLSGSGALVSGQLELPVRQGQSWFLPAAAKPVDAVCSGGEPLRIAQSLPALG